MGQGEFVAHLLDSLPDMRDDAAFKEMAYGGLAMNNLLRKKHHAAEHRSMFWGNSSESHDIWDALKDLEEDGSVMD